MIHHANEGGVRKRRRDKKYAHIIYVWQNVLVRFNISLLLLTCTVSRHIYDEEMVHSAKLMTSNVCSNRYQFSQPFEKSQSKYIDYRGDVC